MERYRGCEQYSYNTAPDLLKFAPCPPPMFNYSDFYEYALSLNLSHPEVCNITKRCLPSVIDAEVDCCSWPSTDVSRTSSTTEKSTRTEESSGNTANFSLYSTTISLEQTTYPPASSSNTLIITIGVVCTIVLILGCILWRKARTRQKRKQQSNQSIKVEGDNEGRFDDSKSGKGIKGNNNCVTDNNSTNKNTFELVTTKTSVFEEQSYEIKVGDKRDARKLVACSGNLSSTRDDGDRNTEDFSKPGTSFWNVNSTEDDKYTDGVSKPGTCFGNGNNTKGDKYTEDVSEPGTCFGNGNNTEGDKYTEDVSEPGACSGNGNNTEGDKYTEDVRQPGTCSGNVKV